MSMYQETKIEPSIKEFRVSLTYWASTLALYLLTVIPAGSVYYFLEHANKSVVYSPAIFIVTYVITLLSAISFFILLIIKIRYIVNYRFYETEHTYVISYGRIRGMGSSNSIIVLRKQDISGLAMEYYGMFRQPMLVFYMRDGSRVPIKHIKGIRNISFLHLFEEVA